MKKLAKLAALLLAGVMVLAMLTACGGDFQADPQAEEAILKYVQEHYETRDNPLTNDATMRQKAAEMLAKVNEDGTISGKDYIQGAEIWYDIYQEEVTIACIDLKQLPERPSMDILQGMLLPMEVYTAGQMPAMLESELKQNQMVITSFGVATRVIGGKTYVAISYIICQSDNS